MSRRRLGLAIGTDALSAVLVAKRGLREADLVQCLHLPLEPSEAGADPLEDALDRLVREVDLDRTECTLAIPAAAFSFRNLSVPFADDRKIRQVIPYELEPLLPEPVDTLICDHLTSGSNGDGASILAAAIGRNRLTGLVDTLKRAGIDPETVLPGGVALACRVAESEATTGDALVLVAALGDTTLVALREGRICLVRSLPSVREPFDREAALARGILQTCRGLADAATPGFSPDRLLMTGAAGLDLQALQRSLAPLSMEILLRSTLPPSARHLCPNADPQSLADAWALATTGTDSPFNFRRGPLRFEPTVALRKKRLIGTGALAAAALLLALANLGLENRQMGRNLARMDQEVERIFRSAAPDVRIVRAPVHQLRQKIEALGAVAGENDMRSGTGRRVTEILAFLSRHVHSGMDVELVQLVIGNDQMTLAGNTDSYNTVNAMKTQLEKERFFSRVEISSATVQRKSGKIQFTLKVAL